MLDKMLSCIFFDALDIHMSVISVVCIKYCGTLTRFAFQDGSIELVISTAARYINS